MRIGFNRDNITFKYMVDQDTYEEDLLMGSRIERMMQSEEWKILVGEWVKMRDLIDNAAKKIGVSERAKELSFIRNCEKNGFDEAVNVANNIVSACKNFRESEIKRIDEELKLKAGEDLTVPSYD